MALEIACLCVNAAMGSGIDPKDELKITDAEKKELAELDKRGVEIYSECCGPRSASGAPPISRVLLCRI